MYCCSVEMRKPHRLNSLPLCNRRITGGDWLSVMNTTKVRTDGQRSRFRVPEAANPDGARGSPAGNLDAGGADRVATRKYRRGLGDHLPELRRLDMWSRSPVASSST